MGSPSIILTSQFQFSNLGKIFGGFLNYIGREEAIEEEKRREQSSSQIYFSEEKIDEHIKSEISELLNNQEKDYDGFIGYMKRSEAILNETDAKRKVDSFVDSEIFNEKIFTEETKKYTGLFTSEIDNLTVDEVEFYQQKFIEAQEADSFLWQDVVSFSEEFARESGLIDPKTNQVAQSRIIEATRKMMQKSFEKENMLDTGIWVASVHVNTDNLHVHVATVETENTRPMKTFIDENGKEYRQRKGMRKQTTLDQMKYTFFNSLQSEKDLLSRINELRNELTKEIVPKAFNHARENVQFQKLIETIKNEANKIPQGKRKWAYKTQTKKNKENIQKAINMLLKENKSYQEFQEKAKQYSDTRQDAYGQSKKKENQNYLNRMKDMENRLGNRLLKEIKALTEEEELSQTKNNSNLLMERAIEKINRNFHQNLEEAKNTLPKIKNFHKFSTKNQEKIQKAYGKKNSENLTLFSEERWKKMHFEPKPDAKGVIIYVPKVERDEKGNQNRSFQKKKYYDKNEVFTRYRKRPLSKNQEQYKTYPQYRLSYRDFNHLKRMSAESYREWQAEQFHQSIQRQIEWEQSRADYGRE